MLLFVSDFFGDTVISVVERFQELAKQEEASFHKLLPRRTSNMILLDCCTWDLYSGGSGPNVFSWGATLFAWSRSRLAMLSCLGNVDEILVPLPGSRAGSFMSSQDANDRCLSHGLGSDPRGTLESRSVEGPASFMAHQPSGDVGCISCSQEFPSRSQGLPCACPLRQYIGGVLLKSPGGLQSRPLCKLACQILLWSQGMLLSLRAAYIPRAHNIGADILSRQGLRPRGWRLHTEVVELIWRHEWICFHREMSHCPLWFSLTHPLTLGPDAMVQTWPRLCLYAFPRSICSGESWREFAGTGFSYFSLHRGGRAEYGSQIEYPFSTGLLWSSPSGGTFCSKQGAWYFTPNQNYGNCGLGPSHRLGSLNRGCWDHSPLQSSLHEETLCLEVESFHFLV